MLQTCRNKLANIEVSILSLQRGKTTSNNTFYLVDVFGQEKYSGNQLAVITNAGNLTETQMQKIANETHFSETTFITSNEPNHGGYDVRIFTPSTELPFAGHPTLGTAYIINQFVAKKKQKTVKLNLKVGQIPVNFQQTTDGKEQVWMKQAPPKFGKTYPKTTITKLLSIKEADLDTRYPIEIFSTGLPFIIVPLLTLDSVKKAKINHDVLSKIAEQNQTGILIFSPQTYNTENQLNVRVFVDAFGIPEDPATGSANGCLAAYLSKRQYFGTKNINIKVEQGFEISRPSILHLKTKTKNSDIEVQVGGQVFLVAKGEFI